MKILPLSAFTGKPEYYQALHFLDDVILRCRPLLNTINPDESNSLFKWHNRLDLSKQLSINLTDHQYHTFLARLNTLRPFAKIPEISTLLSPLSPNLERVLSDSPITSETVGPASLLKRKLAYFETSGGVCRVVNGIGGRKCAEAKVRVKIYVKNVPNIAPIEISDLKSSVQSNSLSLFVNFLVNELPIHSYFPMIKDRYKVGKVLALTNTFSCIEAKAEVHGGGKSGQAGAIALALARALGLASPQWYKMLNEEGMLKRDPRIVERKKPGQEKARKKFTWVKR